MENRLVVFCCKHVMFLYMYVFLFIHTVHLHVPIFCFYHIRIYPGHPNHALSMRFLFFVLGHFRAGVAQISSLRQPKPEIKPRYCWTVSCAQQEVLGFFIGDSYLIMYDLHPYLHYKTQVSPVPVVRYSA